MPRETQPASSARVQVGKLKELCAPWGVAPKELDKLVEVGAVRPLDRARGKGSLRLLDERSLCDVFFAHSLKELGVRQAHYVKVVECLRARYPVLLSKKPERLIVRFAPRREGRDSRIRPDLVFDTRPLFRSVEVLLAAQGAAAQIHRGRPTGDWRATFRDAVTQLSTEMQLKGISEEQIGAAIEDVRADRRRRAQEAVVTVPLP
jgi:hypothetical protein